MFNQDTWGTPQGRHTEPPRRDDPRLAGQAKPVLQKFFCIPGVPQEFFSSQHFNNALVTTAGSTTRTVNSHLLRVGKIKQRRPDLGLAVECTGPCSLFRDRGHNFLFRFGTPLCENFFRIRDFPGSPVVQLPVALANGE